MSKKNAKTRGKAKKKQKKAVGPEHKPSFDRDREHGISGTIS
jgi:hypothetical protein